MAEGFAVGDWTVIPRRNLLVRNGEHARLEPRVMDALVVLAERPGAVVSKEELTTRIWNGQFVTDDVVTVTIYGLRKALGDEARRPRYIETVSRRGYRLIATVGAAPATQARSGTEHAAQTQTVQRGWYSWPAVAGVVALTLFVGGAIWMLADARPDRHVPTAEFHEAYVKGRYFLDQRSIRGWQQALEQFQRAVALDPQSSAAQAGLADAYSAMSDFGVAAPADMRPRAMEAAQRALQMDPQSAEGHAALGRAQFLFDWDFVAAEQSLVRAIALDPDHMPAHQAMAWLQSARGRHTEAAAAARRARQLDPVNTARYTELAWVLSLGGQHVDALREIERALQVDPRSSDTYLMKGWVYEQTGGADAAFAAYREALSVSGAPEEALRRSDAAFRGEGLAGFYRAWLNRRGGNTPMSETWRAQVYVRLGELDSAIQSLEHAYQSREGALAWVNVDPVFRPLRSDPRFQRIAARIGQGHRP